MKDFKQRLKFFALSVLAVTTLAANTAHAQLDNSCATNAKDIIVRGVVFVTKTEVNSEQVLADSPQKNKDEYQDYQCLLDAVVNFDGDSNSVTPQTRTEITSAVKSLLQKNGVSTTTDSKLAKRFKDDSSVILHITNFIIAAPDSYLAFWYEFIYSPSDDDVSALCEVETKTYDQLNGVRFIPLPRADQKRESLKALNSDACLSEILNEELKLKLVDELLSYANHARQAEDVILDFLRSL